MHIFRDRLFRASMAGLPLAGLLLLGVLGWALAGVAWPHHPVETPASLVVGLALLALLLIALALEQQRRRTVTEGARQRSDSLLLAYFANAPEALFMVHVAADGTLRYGAVNPACEALTGLPREAVAGKCVAELFPPDMAAAVERRYRACLAAGGTYAYAEARQLRGQTRELHTILCPVADATGAITALVGSSRDTTDQSTLLAEQHRASEQHRVGKMEAVGRLTAGVAHDFNNYLQTIVSSLDIMTAEYLATAEAQDIGQTAHEAAAGAGKLIHHLMAFSRQQVLQPQRVNVADLLGETCKLAGTSLLGPGVQLKIALEPFTQDIHVDPVQAQSCLLSLLLNARDAMPGGGRLVLHARNATVQDGSFGNLASGGHVILAVHDTGHGMDEHTRAHAFEPFFTTKTFGKGSGLGLSMVQGFCHQSGGDIRILSGGAVGTRVELWLPAASMTMVAAEERCFNIATIGQDTGRVLLVMDEREVSLALAAVMVSAGFEVVAVDTAADGFLRLQDRDAYDAVLADAALQDMAGADFLSQVAARRPGLPLLLLSGYDRGDPLVQGLPHVAHLLAKPIRGSVLLNALREAIGASRQAMAA